MKNLTQWTITSPDGQMLCASEEPNGDVSLSSSAGNHGSVTRKVFDDKLALMASSGYTYTTKTNPYNV